MTGGNAMTGEQRLWQEVVLMAVTDATNPAPHNGEEYRAKVEARDWLEDGKSDFCRVCDLAGMDPDFVRDAYRAGRIDRNAIRRRSAARAEAWAIVKGAGDVV